MSAEALAPPARERVIGARNARWYGPDAVVLLAMAVVFVCARVIAQLGAPITVWADTPTYADLDFFGGSIRPWPVPLLWKIVPGPPSYDAYAHVFLAIVAWLFLAFATYRVCRHRAVALGGFALVLLTGLGVQTAEWDMALLSESLSITTTVGLLGAVMLAVDRLTPSRAVGLALILTVWTATRPANFTLLAACLVPILVALLWTRRRDVILWVVVPLLVVTVWNGFATSREQNIWVQNATAITQSRLLGDPAARAYLYSKGMPQSAVVEGQIGKEYLGYDSPLGVDPEFKAWIIAEFKPMYAEYLLRHPGYAIGQPLSELPELVTSRVNYTKAAIVLPAVLELTLWPAALELPFMLLAVLGLAFFTVRTTRSARRLAVPFLGGAIAIAWVIITWHLGYVDPIRLQVTASSLLHVSSILLVVFSIDALLTQRARGAEGDGPSASTPDAAPVPAEQQATA